MSLTPPYSLLTRTSKGSQLTIEELDGNLLFLASTLSGSNTITGSVNFTGSLVDFLQVGTVTGSFSGDGSGLTGVTATVPAGTVSSSLQFTSTDDVTFRNITASGNISSSGTVTGLSGSFSHIYSGGDINIDNQGKLWLDGGQDTYIWASANNHIGLVAGDNQTLTVDGTSIEVDGYISASGTLFVKQIDMQDSINAKIDMYKAGSLITSFNTKGNVHSFIEASGSAANLGVGTNAPTEKLHVSGNIKVDGYITGSDFIQVAGVPGQHTGVKISASNSEGDVRDAQMIVPVHGFEIKNSSHNNVFKIAYDHVGINTQYPSNFDYALRVSGSSGGTKAIEAIGDISSSGDIIATGTGSFNYVTTPIIEGSGSTALLHIEGAISASGDLSIAGFPSVSASLASGGGFTPSLSTDLPARNITASANISSSGIITAGFYNIGNQAALIPSADTLALADETGGALGLFYTKTTSVTIGTSTAQNGAALGVNGNITTNSHITASGNISSSGTVIASGVNVDTTDASATSFDIGTGEHIIPVLGTVNASSSAIISQQYPSGRIGRTTQIIGDARIDIGPAAYPIDGHHVFYHSGSRELWKASGEWDLSALGQKRTVGNQLQYGDGNLAGNAFTFNDYRLIVGENVNEVWGGAFLMGRQSGSTYGSNQQYAGFFASGSLGLPGTPQGHDKAFTIYTGDGQTGPAFNIYNADDPDNAYNNNPVFSIAANGALGNVTASNISSSGALYGSILTAAQIGITQVGMLTSLAVNGNSMLAGNVTQSGHISSSGDLIGDNLQVETRTMPINHMGGGAGVRSGDIINLGNSTTVPGLIYALTGSSYEYVAAQSGSGALASGSLAVAIGTNSNTDGMLMRGFVNLGHDPGGHIGAAVYLTANGSASYSAPTATGDVVRVLGHNFGNNSIYFNPSNDWIVRS